MQTYEIKTPEPSVQPSEDIAQGAHFPFDWNGWGIGVEADPAAAELHAGERIAAWELAVRSIADGCGN